MITNEWICGNCDISVPIGLRKAVFVCEQGFEDCEEIDEFDAQAMHVVVYDEGVPIGTGRVYHDGKTFRIGRICVLKEKRKQGVGDLIMRVLLIKAFEFQPSEVRLDAQKRVMAFYENFGFAVCGEELLDGGIVHVPMSVNKDTLIFKSGCGKTMNYADLFPQEA
ncbi:MAG: GNAT family N-acetyltransferase [Christensenellaceae bacterium]